MTVKDFVVVRWLFGVLVKFEGEFVVGGDGDSDAVLNGVGRGGVDWLGDRGAEGEDSWRKKSDFLKKMGFFKSSRENQ